MKAKLLFTLKQLVDDARRHMADPKKALESERAGAGKAGREYLGEW
jgi:hypothetical protein